MGYVNADALYEALKEGTTSMDDFMDAIVKLDTEGAEGILSFQEQAKNSCDSIGTAITNTANRFKKGFATILGSMNEAAKNTSFGSIASMINSFSTSIKNFLDRIGNAIKQNETFNTTINQVANWLTKLNNVINGLSDEQLDKIVTAIINLAKAGPILLAVGKGFGVLSSGFNVLSGGAKILESMPSKLNGLTGVVKGLGGNLKGATGVFTDFFSKIGSGFSTMFSGGIFDKIGTFFSNGFGKITSILSNFGNTLLKPFQLLGSKIGTLLSPLGNALSSFGGKISGVFSKITSGIASAIPNVTAGLSKITGAFGGIFGKIGSSMGSFLPIFTKCFNIAGIIGLVVAGLGLLEGQFGDQINSFLSMVTEKGSEIITNLCNGIVSKIPDLMAKGGELLQNLLTAIIANLPSIIQGRNTNYIFFSDTE